MIWPFKESEETKARKKREKDYQTQCAQGIEALQRGEILPRAKERIELQMAAGHQMFSSGLSVNEFLVAKEAGLQILGQVMGTAFYNIGWPSRTNRGTGEIWEISEAHRRARNDAVMRLKKEAELFGADGVIGVRLKTDDSWNDLVEFTAVGTAVKIPGWSEADRADAPFVCELSGQEFWQLMQAGYRPSNIVFGLCAYYISTDLYTRQLINPGFNVYSNQEVSAYTDGYYRARNTAMTRLNADIQQWHADGCVGMTVSSRLREIEYEINDTKYRDLLVTFTALGSSIKRLTNPPPAKDRKLLTCLNLATKQFVSLGGSRMDELGGKALQEDYDDEDEHE
jgi:uncharacterized protein YbjQ (UPF0145 family)